MNTKQTATDAYLVLFFGQFARWPFCLFWVPKSAESPVDAGFKRGGRFWFEGCEFNSRPLPWCKPQTLQTSVCSRTLAQCRAVASRIGISPGRTPFAWARLRGCRAPASMPGCRVGRAARARHQCALDAQRKKRGGDSVPAARSADRAGSIRGRSVAIQLQGGERCAHKPAPRRQ